MTHLPIAYNPPSWAAKLKRIPETRLRLALTPTRIDHWSVPDLEPGVRLYLKRDDCTGLVLSGNKVRKLEFLFAEALRQNCDTVITCGALQSNHCRAVAAAARECGLDCILLLRTSQGSPDLGYNGNLLLDRLLAVRVVQVTPGQYHDRARIMAAISGNLSRKGKRAYLIPEGGSNSLGAWGYIEGMAEVCEQLEQTSLSIDDIVVACGSGGTAAGLTLAAALSGSGIRVHAVNVCSTALAFRKRITDMLEPLISGYDPAGDLDIIDGYVGQGYGRATREDLVGLQRVAEQTGIFLDPVYTWKAFKGMLNELRNRPHRFKGRRILFLHTGGLFGLYAWTDDLRGVLLADKVESWASQS